MSSKKCDSMPVAPTLPISSLSTKSPQAVVLGSATSIIAIAEGYAQHLSSCPYARIIERSSPASLAFPAGTTSISAEMKSSSSISYSFLSISRIAFLTASFSSPFTGFEPIRISRSSPFITSEAVSFIWS